MTASQAHDRFVTKAVGVVLIAACIPMWWWDTHWPGWLVDIINPVLVTTVAYALARWKRSRLAWGMFWVLAGLYAVSVVLWVTGGLGLADTSAAAEAAGLVLISLVVCLVRIPRVHPPAAPKVSHVVHHHVLHGPDGRAVEVEPGRYGEVGSYGSVPAEVDSSEWAAVGNSVPKAIESGVARLGQLAGQLQKVRRPRA